MMNKGSTLGGLALGVKSSGEWRFLEARFTRGGAAWNRRARGCDGTNSHDPCDSSRCETDRANTKQDGAMFLSSDSYEEKAEQGLSSLNLRLTSELVATAERRSGDQQANLRHLYQIILDQRGSSVEDLNVVKITRRIIFIKNKKDNYPSSTRYRHTTHF